MKLEKQIFNVITDLGYDAYWTYKDLNDPKTDANEPEAAFPLVVLNFISDNQPIYIQGTAASKEGRITFTLYSKTRGELFDMKEIIRNELLSGSSATNFNFSENTGFDNYDNNSKTYEYQLDFSYLFNGVE